MINEFTTMENIPQGDTQLAPFIDWAYELRIGKIRA
jgi:hypothetical protein